MFVEQMEIRKIKNTTKPMKKFSIFIMKSKNFMASNGTAARPVQNQTDSSPSTHIYTSHKPFPAGNEITTFGSRSVSIITYTGGSSGKRIWIKGYWSDLVGIRKWGRSRYCTYRIGKNGFRHLSIFRGTRCLSGAICITMPRQGQCPLLKVSCYCSIS